MFCVSIPILTLPGKEKFERTMKPLDEVGKWRWMDIEILPDYCTSIETGESADGIKYLFQKC